MKKLAKVFLIVLGAVIALFVILTIGIKAYLAPERIKSFLIPEAEKALNRKVGIGDINISLFRGIRVMDISIKESDDKTDFVKCREFVLKYQLLPLLSKKVVIDELKLVSPEVNIVRGINGRFNYEGIGEKPGEVKDKTGLPATKPPETRPLPVSLLVDKVRVVDARISFSDRKKEMPAFKGLLDADIGLRFAEGASQKAATFQERLKGLKIDGKIDINEANIEHKNVKVILKGDLKFDEQAVNIDINSSIGKNAFQIKGSVENFGFPDIKMNLYAKQLYLDELIPAGKTSGPQAQGKSEGVKEAKEAAPAPKLMNPRLDLKLTASGEAKIEKARYRDMDMSNFYLKYRLKNNIFEIADMRADVGRGKFNLRSAVDLSKPGFTYKASGKLDSLHAEDVVNAFFPKAKDTVFGLLSMNIALEGSGTTPDSIKRNLAADSDFNIKDGKITNAKLMDSLALFLGISELRTINLRQGSGTVRVRNGVARLESIFSSDDISMNPSGNIGLDETLGLSFDLKLSPRLTAAATRKSSIASYISDEKGWGSIPLKVTGTFSKPSYTVDFAKAGKGIIEKKGDELLRQLFK